MSNSGLEVFDSTIQKSNSWLHDLMAEMKIENRQTAYQTFRAVMHALRDRLSPAEVADLASELPLLLRGVFYEGWSPSMQRPADRSQETFLDDVRSRYGGKLYASPKEMAEAVFMVISMRMSAGEMSDVRHLLPRHVRDLWPQERMLA